MAVANWMKARGLLPQVEQEVPRWSTPTMRAVLDVVYTDPRGGPTALDITIAESTAQVRPGEGSEQLLTRKEGRKHRRYPGPGLVPVALDTRGRWGREGLLWARGLIARTPQSDRGTAAAALFYEVSAALHRGVAEQILAALTAPRAGEPDPGLAAGFPLPSVTPGAGRPGVEGTGAPGS